MALIQVCGAQTATVLSSQQFGGTAATSQASIRKILRGSTGDIYVLYAFAQNITVPVSFVPPTTSWGAAIFKYDPSFSMVQEKLFLSNMENNTTNVQTVPLDMTLDAQNNLYVVGYATGPSLIWSYDGEMTNTTPIPSEVSSGNRPFMVKLSSNLQPVAQQMFPVEASQMAGVCMTKGKVAVCGYYSSATTADFGNGITMTKTNTYENGYVVLFDPNLAAQKIIPITSNYRLYVYRVASDTAGNIYVSGSGYGTVKFGDYSGQSYAIGSSSGTQYTFCASYTANGTYRWAAVLKGAGTERPEDLTVDKDGNVYLVGHQGTSNNLQWVGMNGYAQNVVLAANPTKNTGSMLLMKLDGTTGKLLWYNMMSSASGTDHLGAVTTDVDGDVYVAGTVNGAANMNPNGNAYPVNASGLTNQGVLAKYSGKNGQCLFAYAEGGSSGKVNYKTVYSSMLGRTQLLLAPNKNIYWAGIFEGTVQFQLGGSSPVNFALAAGRTSNYSDMFVMRIGQQMPASYSNKPKLHAAVRNVEYLFQFAYTGLPEGAVYTAADQLPAGLTLSADGKLQGTMSTPGTYSIRVAVKNGNTTLYADSYALEVIELTTNTKQVLASQDSSFRFYWPAQRTQDYNLYYSVNVPDCTIAAENNAITLPFSAFAAGNNMVYIKVVNPNREPAEIYLDSIFVVTFDNTTRAPGGVFGASLWLRNDIGVKTVPDHLGNQRLMKGSGWLDISGGHTMNLWAFKANPAAVYGPKKLVKQLNGEAGYTFTPTDSILVEGKEFSYFQSLFGVADFGEITQVGTVLGMYEPYAYDPTANVSNQLKYFFSQQSSKLYTYDAKANMSVSSSAGPNLFYSDFKTNRADALLLNGAQRLNDITQNYSQRDKLMYARPFVGTRVRSDGQFSTLMQGDIYEIINFSKPLTDAERWRVESYLAFKYGLTLYGNTIGSLVSSMRRAYYLSDGTVCYDARSTSRTPDHFMFLTALVRDDVSALHKPIAGAYGNGNYHPGLPNSDSLSVILKQLVNGGDRNHPQAIPGDKDFFMVGSQSYIYSDKQFEKEFLPGTSPLVYSTWKQSWFVRRTPAMESVCLAFDLSKIPSFGDTIRPEKVGLVVMDAAQGTQATRFTFIPATEVDTLTLTAYFDAVNIPDESFIRLAFDSEEGLHFTNADLPQGRVRERYTAAFTAAGDGSTAFVYALTAGQLPEGLSLSSDGALDGAPVSSADTYTFTLRATDQRGFYAEKTFQLVVAPDIQCPPVMPTKHAIKAGRVGENTRINLNIKELGNYKVWTLAEGTLPNGLVLNAGVLMGVPQSSGTQNIRVLVKDANSCTGDVNFDLEIEVPQKLNAKAVTMYPNPAQGEVNLSIASPTTAPIRVQIFNSGSTRVKDVSFAAGTRTGRINLSGLAPGQYFVLLSSDGSIVQLLLAIR